MPRTARASVGGVCYHVMNRGNGRRQVFHKDGDYHAFVKAIYHACVEIPMPVLGYCLMPNHFHLVVLPENDADLSVWMHWLQNTHVRRYHKHYHSSGHIWQGRFKAFPIQEDEHLLIVLRYVERNPVRANIGMPRGKLGLVQCSILAKRSSAAELFGGRSRNAAAALARLGQ